MEKNELMRRWEAAAAWIDARNLRERAAIFGLLAAAVVFVGYDLGIAPRVRDIERHTKQITADSTSLSKLENEIARLSGQAVLDPNEQNRKQIEALQQEIERINAMVQNHGRNFVKPEEMAAMLENLIARQGSLNLVSLTKLPLQDLMSAGLRANAQAPGQTNPQAPADGKTPAETVYKHGMRVVVQGSYADLVSYLHQLESLSERLGWGEIRLEANDYPKSTLSFDIYTFSLEKTWLHI
jgi:MSHA biogenesis protein MshJ